MAEASIVFFPVGNGDTSLIKLTDGTSILIDSNITKDSMDEDNSERYDVYSFLYKEIRKTMGIKHLDAFILTHADDDHCRGIGEVCYLGDPDKYSDEDKKNGLIVIDELWFTPRLFLTEEAQKSECAKLLKKEAERRMSLYKSNKEERDEPGNRIRIIGFTENKDLKGLEDIITVPGNLIDKINGKKKDDFRFFIYAPVKKHVDDISGERNDSSIIVQARFDIDGEEEACIAFFGGDAGCLIWENVIDKNDEDNLKWDLLLAPHHCSWYFFSEDDSKDEDAEPSQKLLDLLDMKREGAWVISSSKPIIDDDNNPPHFRAAKIYKDKVGKSNFLCTGEHPDTKSPQPIIFLMSANGPVKDDLNEDQKSSVNAAVKSVLSTPTTYGR